VPENRLSRLPSYGNGAQNAFARIIRRQPMFGRVHDRMGLGGTRDEAKSFDVAAPDRSQPAINVGQEDVLRRLFPIRLFSQTEERAVTGRYGVEAGNVRSE